MALLQAVLSDPDQTVVTYPSLTVTDADTDSASRHNIFQRIRKNFRQFLNILPG